MGSDSLPDHSPQPQEVGKTGRRADEKRIEDGVVGGMSWSRDGVVKVYPGMYCVSLAVWWEPQTGTRLILEFLRARETLSGHGEDGVMERLLLSRELALRRVFLWAEEGVSWEQPGSGLGATGLN